MWNALKPVLNERTRQKVTITSGVPDQLRDAVGGEDALQRMLRSVPPALPVDSGAEAPACEPASAPACEPAVPIA